MKENTTRMKKITAVVSVFDSPGWTSHCIERIWQNTHFSGDLIVINNGSRSKTSKLLNILKEQKYIDLLINNEKNMGSAYSWNQALNYVNTPYVAFIHSDCIVSPNWDIPLIKVLDENEHIACASPITNYADQFYLIHSGTVFDDYVKMKMNNKQLQSYIDIEGLIDDFYMFDDGFNKFAQKQFKQYEYSIRYMSELGTHCLMFKTELFHKLGWWDDDFFPHFGFEKIMFNEMEKRKLAYVACLGSYVHHNGNTTSDGMSFNAKKMLEENEKLVNKKLNRN